VANLNTVPQWWLRTGGFEQVREEQPAEFRAFALPYRPYRPKTTRVEESSGQWRSVLFFQPCFREPVTQQCLYHENIWEQKSYCFVITYLVCQL
jgi:hypothetical protein